MATGPSLDTWYVRLPDGRVLKAGSTHVVRHHVGSGRIPVGSRVRRSAEQEWVELEWTEEFADLLKRPGGPNGIDENPRLAAETSQGQSGGRVASRYDPARLRTIGLRSLVEELLAALDNTLAPQKLVVASSCGVFGGLLYALVSTFEVPFEFPRPLSPGLVAGVILGIVAVLCDVLLTQITYTELSRLRPARWDEAARGLMGLAARLLASYVIIGGCLALAMIYLRKLPAMTQELVLPERWRWVSDTAPPTAAVAALLGEVVLWALAAFTLLVAPVVIVEEKPLWGTMLQWWWMVRRHLGRLFLYESAAALGGVAMLAFAFPLALAAWGRLGRPDALETPTFITFCVLTGLALGPLLAYLAVAQVFIYLNLRYEPDPRGRR